VAEPKDSKNIFQIMDELVRQLNKTKKMFLIMIVSIVVVVPGTFVATFALAGGNSFWDDNQPHGGVADGPPDGAAFGIARAIVAVFVIAWIVIGVRQWLILSKWTQRYELYKELQKKIDEKLDYDDDNEQK
jgi:cell division protein FtsL